MARWPSELKPEEKEEESVVEEEGWRIGHPWEPHILQPILWNIIGMLNKAKGVEQVENLFKLGETRRGRETSLDGALRMIKDKKKLKLQEGIWKARRPS